MPFQGSKCAKIACRLWLFPALHWESLQYTTPDTPAAYTQFASQQGGGEKGRDGMRMGRK